MELKVTVAELRKTLMDFAPRSYSAKLDDLYLNDHHITYFDSDGSVREDIVGELFELLDKMGVPLKRYHTYVAPCTTLNPQGYTTDYYRAVLNGKDSSTLMQETQMLTLDEEGNTVPRSRSIGLRIECLCAFLEGKPFPPSYPILVHGDKPDEREDLFAVSPTETRRRSGCTSSALSHSKSLGPRSPAATSKPETKKESGIIDASMDKAVGNIVNKGE